MIVTKREAHPMQLQHQTDRATSPSMKLAPAESTALGRLEASRALIRSTMQSRVREVAAQRGDARHAPTSLAQRLLNRVQRLPIVRTAVEIRSLRRG